MYLTATELVIIQWMQRKKKGDVLEDARKLLLAIRQAETFPSTHARVD